MLSLQAYGTSTGERAIVGALVTIQEVACVELQTRLGGIDLKGTSTLGLGNSGGKAQFTLFLFVQHIVVVEAVTKFDLLVVGLNILTKGLGSTEVEGGTCYLKDFTRRDGGVVSRQIEIGIDFTNLILDGGSGVSGTCKCESG